MYNYILGEKDMTDMTYIAFGESQNLLIPQSAGYYKVSIKHKNKEKSYIVKAFSDFNAARKIKDLTGLAVRSSEDVKGPLTLEEIEIMKKLNADVHQN